MGGRSERWEVGDGKWEVGDERWEAPLCLDEASAVRLLSREDAKWELG